jgi:hypothetical protein
MPLASLNPSTFALETSKAASWARHFGAGSEAESRRHCTATREPIDPSVDKLYPLTIRGAAYRLIAKSNDNIRAIFKPNKAVLLICGIDVIAVTQERKAGPFQIDYAFIHPWSAIVEENASLDNQIIHTRGRSSRGIGNQRSIVEGSFKPHVPKKELLDACPEGWVQNDAQLAAENASTLP